MPNTQVLSAKEFKANFDAVIDQVDQSSVIFTKGKKRFAVVEVVDNVLSEEDRKMLLETDFESPLTRFVRRIRYHCF